MNHLTPDVDAPASGHPGSAAAFAARITERWRASVENIIEAGRILLEAKNALHHGEFGVMCESQLPFSARTAQRLMAIAQDNRLSNPTIASHLPASWTTLADLAGLTDAEFYPAVEQNIIRPDMIRADIDQIRALTRQQPVLESSSGVEQETHNLLVAGSIPASPTIGDTGEPAGYELPSNAGTDATGDTALTAGSPVLPSGGLAIAHRRIEEADSLDFFPTPPWATRALIEHVMPHLERRGHCQYQKAWEPACGEGHMAAPLGEYFKHVYASDIADYGYGDGDRNFLTAGVHEPYDWIITNPPFNDSADFVLKAIRIAGTGVAMFVRLAWLESAGRYEKIFTPHPPTLISFFAERVPLHKGRWEEDGATMTAYIWLVWIKGAEPRPPFWIPPGCREALTKPEDAKRFGTKSPRRDAGARMEEGQPTVPVVPESSEAAA